MRRSCVSAAFFDTNIIFYAADTDSPEQDHMARTLLRSRVITVSTQVMLETYGALRRKLAYGPEDATAWVQTLKNEIVISLSPQDVLDGIMIARRYDLSHWDGLILRAAESANLDIIYSEDMNHGQIYGSVRVCNPFKEDFLA